MELIVAREVIAQWNAHHALQQKRILLPLGEDVAGDENHDLLLEFFCSCVAAAAEDDAESDLDRQLRGGRPALVYFSRARADLRGHGTEGSALPDFQRRHPLARVACYADEKEFRAQFAQQLDALLGSHPHFRSSAVDSRPAATAHVAPAPPKVEAPLSDRARRILFEACDDFEAYVGFSRVGGTLRIQANGKQLVDGHDAATVAAWDNAFRELLDGGYIRDAGFNGQLFQISTKGFDFLKTLGKTPVGYIAELGGM